MRKCRSRKWAAVAVAAFAFIGLAVLAAFLIERESSSPYLAALPEISTENWRDTAAQRSPLYPAWVTPELPFTFAATGAVDDAGGIAARPRDEDLLAVIGDLSRAQEIVGSDQSSTSMDSLAGYALDQNLFNSSTATSGVGPGGAGPDLPSNLGQFGEASFSGDGLTSGHHGHKFAIPIGAMRLALGTGYDSDLYNTGGLDLAVNPTIPFDDSSPAPAAPLPSTAWGGFVLLAGIGAWQLRRRRKPQKTQNAE